MRRTVFFLIVVLACLNVSDSGKGLRTTAAARGARIERIEKKDLPQHMLTAMESERPVDNSQKKRPAVTRVDPDNNPVRSLHPNEPGPSFLQATFSEDEHYFANAIKYGAISVLADIKGVAFGGTLQVTERQTRNMAILVGSNDLKDARIYSENGQHVVDDGFFICRLTAQSEVLYGASAGLTFLGVGASGEHTEGLSFKTNHQQCIGIIELQQDEYGHKIGVPVKELEDFCNRCTGGIQGEVMNELMQQSHQRALNQTKFHISDKTCENDDACYTNDLRYTGRCILKSESRKIEGKDKVYYYRRCEGRVKKNGYCTPYPPSGFIDWIGPRSCDAGLKCVLTKREYDWWHFRYDEDFHCFPDK